MESGSRQLFNSLAPELYRNHGEGLVVDLVTCYGGVPEGLQPRARVYRVMDYAGRAGRKRLYRELAANRYTILGMICSAEPIMTKWKWALALRVPAKVFVVNENGDRFWLDRAHAGIIRHFVLFRMGLTGAAATPTLVRLILFPLALAYLALFAGWVHLRRAIRLLIKVPS